MSSYEIKKSVEKLGEVDRRKFLAATSGLAASALLGRPASAASGGPAPQPGSLAIDGGTPVRATKLRSNFPGPLYYDDQERQELIDVLNARAPFRWYGIGPAGGHPNKCNQFEKEFAAHQGTKYCVAVTSGTAALIVAVAALGVGPGDEVILPAWTWYSCYDAIIAAGGTPVFAEIDDSANIDPADIERHISPRTKAIMPVHIMGEPADMDSILAIARKHGLKVLEDCAQTLGGTYKGRPVGSLGDVGIYSFQVCKTISAGEGGAVVTNDPAIFERAARFHDLGQLRDPHAVALGQPARQEQMVGWQFRMSEYTGAVMRAQLRKLDRIVADFRQRAKQVTEGISDLPGIQLRKSNDPEGGLGTSVCFRTGGKPQRDRMINALEAENISAGALEGSVILPLEPFVEKKQSPEHDWPSFASAEGKRIHYGASCCPRTIDIRERYVVVPIDPKYTDKEVNDVIAANRKVYSAVVNA